MLKWKLSNAEVLQETEELRRYYEEQNCERVARAAAQSPELGTEAAWEKLQAAKAKRQLVA